MKYKYYIYCVIMAAFALQACSNMNELADVFLDEGEIIYAAKVDSVAPHSGKNRLELEIFITAQRIQTLRIFWNNGTDSTELAINGNTGVFNKMIDNLDESQYIFHLVSFDKFGNHSLPFEVTGNVLGENYQKAILSRSLNTVKASYTGTKTATWGSFSATQAISYTELWYTNTDNKEMVLKTPTTETKTVIPDNKGHVFKYRTVYIPDAVGVDTFYTDFNELEIQDFPLDKSEWKIDSFSSEHDNGNNAAKNVIDGTDATRWHTKADGRGYPHWVVVNLGGNVSVTQFAVWATTFEQSAGSVDGRCPTKIQFWVSTDNENWTQLGGDYNCDNKKLGAQLYPVTETTAKYFKFIGVEGTDNNMVLGELDAYIK